MHYWLGFVVLIFLNPQMVIKFALGTASVKSLMGFGSAVTVLNKQLQRGQK